MGLLAEGAPVLIAAHVQPAPVPVMHLSQGGSHEFAARIRRLSHSGEQIDPLPNGPSAPAHRTFPVLEE
jgi:hypothetical protein